jgi:hypothetical protein
MRYLVLLPLLLATACASYDPPVAGDRHTPKFQADLDRCRRQAAKNAAIKANATPQSSVRALFQSDDAEHADLVSCMKFRGYKPLAAG